MWSVALGFVPMGRIAIEGTNCWRVVRADRVAFLFDAGPYYEAVAAALERARHPVFAGTPTRRGRGSSCGRCSIAWPPRPRTCTCTCCPGTTP